MKRMTLAAALAASLMLASCWDGTERIDRHAVVTRHNTVITKTMPKSPAQVGNGKFAFNFDITGLQTFIPFNTLSDWGWHSFPVPDSIEGLHYVPRIVSTHGREIAYIDKTPENLPVAKYLEQNPHRFNLGRIGFVILDSAGNPVEENALSAVEQVTDMWTGVVKSSFELDGERVDVVTVGDPERDLVAVSVVSDLLGKGRLKIFAQFPYPENITYADYVGDYENDAAHTSTIAHQSSDNVLIHRQVDTTSYYVELKWNGSAAFVQTGAQRFELTPAEGSQSLEFTALFSEEPPAAAKRASVASVTKRSAAEWKRYWMSGAALDLSQSTDPRWKELERIVVQSQYLMKINETGLYPPQESGLVRNTWYGRYHWEMIWWHAVHFDLWNRPKEFNSYMDIYHKFLPEATLRAQSEGRRGAHWPKCTGGNLNREWPNNVHAYMVWQIPHPIYFAEMEYRRNPKTFDKWKEIVYETADYLADNLFYVDSLDQYVMGPPLAILSENSNPLTTVNPSFELCYFRYGLRTAIEWKKRAGEVPDSLWVDALAKMAPIPMQDGLYVHYENIEDQWGSKTYEHPAVTGLYGMLPGDGIDIEAFSKTLDKVVEVWQMDKIWGWDFPMMAMAAAKCGKPELALDMLLYDTYKAKYDPHGYSLSWPIPYFPGNGGFLSAVAMMCGGWDGCEMPDNQGKGVSTYAPGFPQDGSWVVRHEGFARMQ